MVKFVLLGLVLLMNMMKYNILFVFYNLFIYADIQIILYGLN